MKTIDLELDKLNIGGGTQQRPLDETAVAEYAQLLKDGSESPPIHAVFDGKDYWPWDGFHRYHAARKAGRKTIKVTATNGTLRDAIWLSFSANKDHGVRRQKGVVRAIILKILADSQWRDIPYREISEHVGVSRTYISECASSGRKRPDRPSEKRVTRNGKTYTMETGRIGKKKPLTSADDPDVFYDPPAEKAAPPEPTASEPEPAPEQPKDEVGNLLNPTIAKVFARRQTLKDYMRQISEIKCAVLKSIEQKDELFREISAAQVKANCENLYRQFSFAIPYALCPLHADDPLGRKTCTGCKETGWVTQAAYDRIMASKKRSA